MKLINRRYKVIDEIGKGEFGVIYRVKDIIDQSIPQKALKIYNIDKVGKDNLQNFKKDFLYLKSIYLPCCIKAFEFDRITDIDNSPFTGNYFFFTMEHIKGRCLDEVKFTEKENKLEILTKVLFNLNWLHVNGFWHGDLSLHNIMLNENGDIIFIDLSYRGDIGKEHEHFISIIKDSFGIDIDILKDKIEKIITFKIIQDLLIRKFKSTIKLFHNIAYEIKNNVEGAIFDKKASHFLNFLNFREDAYEVLTEYVKDIAKINEYDVIEIPVDERDFSALYNLVKFIKNNYKYEHILINIEKEYSNLFDSILYNKKVNSHRTELSKLFYDILEKLSYSNHTIIIFKDTLSIDRESRYLIEHLIDSYRSNHQIFIINEIKEYHETDGLKVNNIFIDPFNSQYFKDIIGILENLLFGFDIDNISTALRSVKRIDIITIINIIISSKNIISVDDNRLLSLNNIHFFEKILKIDKNIINKYLETDSYILILAHIYFMHKPIRESLIKYFDNNEFELKIDEMIKDNILVRVRGNKLDIHDYEIYKAIAEKIDEKGKNFVNNILSSIEIIYQNNEKNLNLNEIVGMLNIFYLMDKYQKIATYIKENFIDVDVQLLTLMKNIGKFLKEIYLKNNKSFKFVKNIKTEFILTYSYSVITLKENYEKKIEILKYLENKYQNNSDFLIYIYFSLSDYYDWLPDTDKMKFYIDKLNSLKTYFNRYYFLYFLLIEASYFFKVNDLDKSFNKIRELMRLLRKEKSKNFINLYLLGLGAFSIFSSKLNNNNKQFGYNKLYLEKAKKYQLTNHLFSAHSAMGIYFYYHVNKAESYKHLEKTLLLAEQSGSHENMIYAYNNFIAIEKDVYRQISYLKKALKHASIINDKKHIFVVISNLINLLDDNEEILKIIEEYKEELTGHYKLSQSNLINKLFVYMEMLIAFIHCRGEDQILFYYKSLMNMEIDNLRDNVKQIYNLTKIIYQFVLNGYKNEYFEKIMKIIASVDDDVILSIFEQILYWFYNYFDFVQMKQFFNEIIKQYEKRNLSEDIIDLKVYYRVIYDMENQSSKTTLRYMNRYLNEKFTLNQMKYLILMKYIEVLNDIGNESYINYLSYIFSSYNRDIKKFKNKKYSNIIFWNKIIDKIKDKYPDDFELFIINNENYFIEQGDFNIINDYILNEGSYDFNKYVKKLLEILISELNFERGAIFSSDNFKSPDFVVYRDNILYNRNEKFYFDKYENIIVNKIIVKELIDNTDFIKSYMVLPIIDKRLLKRYIYHVNKSKSSSVSKFEKDFILAYIYLDKKNTVRTKYNYKILKMFMHYISEFWTYRIAEQKYMRDKLTELYFRDVFKSKVSEYIYNISTKYKSIAILMIDIDHFKQVNDTYGHIRGDEILAKMSKLLKNSLRTSDLIGRYGGEEFIIALLNTNQDDSLYVAEKLRKIIKNAKLMGNIRDITISIGVSFYPEDSIWIEELIEKADRALYIAKKTGRNKVISTL